jgi:hypothetical protein
MKPWLRRSHETAATRLPVCASATARFAVTVSCRRPLRGQSLMTRRFDVPCREVSWAVL